MKDTARVYCSTSKPDLLNFYIEKNSESYYLFSQNFNWKVYHFYKEGVPLRKALSFKYGKRQNSHSMMKISEKIQSYIRYVEKEEDLVILEKTKKREQDYRCCDAA